MTAATLVYFLCMITSAICAALLVRAFLRVRTRLLLWTAISFVCFAVNNALVFADLLVGPTLDLLPYRYAAAFASVSALLYCFIRESE